MNSLSWLLYLSDVVGNAGVVIVLICIGCATAAVTFVVAGAKQRDLSEYKRDQAGELERGKALQNKAAPLVIVIGVLMGVGIFIPNKNTIMLIAASQVGETVLASRDVQAIGGEAGALASDSLKLLRKYVTEQLGEEKAP